MLTWLLLLAPVVAIVVIVRNYQRKAAAREAASNERLKEFLAKASATRVTPESNPAGPSTPSPAPTPAPKTSLPPPEEFTVRERMLTPPQTLLYYLLKSNLPDHEVLVHVGIAAFLDVPAGIGGFEREARERRLAGARVDFVVCDKSFRAVAAVQCGAREGGAAQGLAFARSCCESAALRWVEVAPGALPKRETVRAIVLGD